MRINFIHYYQILRYFIFSVVEKILRYPALKNKFKTRTGYDLNIKEPRSFNEKINWKKIYDRNPLLPIISDKYLVREYLKEYLGDEEADRILIPLLYVTDDPTTIPFDELPNEYVIKANHGSGTNIIVRDGDKIDKDEIIEKCNEWLRTAYGMYSHQWSYQKIKRKIVVEKLLKDDNGEIPIDYKFHMMHGECVMIQVNQGYFADKDNRNLTLYSKEWNKYDVFWEFPPADKIEKPHNLNTMINLAEKLSKPLDYVRVDLYSLEGDKIYFGEFTNYPTSGNAVVSPVDFDYWLGSIWNIKPKYWKHI